MEKFGIFELLDALSAMTAPSGAPEGQNKQTPPSPQEAPFSPPVSGATADSAPTANGATDKSDAFSAFMFRHDSISKKIDGSNKKR